jgi:hypothetical protein
VVKIFDKTAKDYFESLFAHLLLPAQERHEAEINRIDLSATAAQRFSNRVSGDIRYTKEFIALRVQAYIATCKKVNKCPDDADYQEFAGELTGLAEQRAKDIVCIYDDPLGPLQALTKEQALESLTLELRQDVGLKLTPLRHFITECRLTAAQATHQTQLKQPEMPATLPSTSKVSDLVFPEELMEKVKVGKMYVLEADSILTEDDLQHLITLMFDYPERSFYFFEEKGSKRNTFIDKASQSGWILFEEYEQRYYPHPNFEHDYVKISKRDGEYNWDWEKEAVEKGPEFIRFTLRLSERKRREMEHQERIAVEKAASPVGEKESAKGASLLSANQLYDKVKGYIENTKPLDEHTARIIVESVDDAIKEYGNSNQEKKVDLRKWKAEAELVLPPSTIEELKKRAEGQFLRKSYPRNRLLRNSLFIAIIVTAVGVPLALYVKDVVKKEVNKNPTPLPTLPSITPAANTTPASPSITPGVNTTPTAILKASNALDVTTVEYTDDGELDITVRNLSNDAVVINAITVTILEDKKLSVTPILEPSAQYKIPIEKLGEGETARLSVRHVIDSHKADRFLLALETTRMLFIEVTLHYNSNDEVSFRKTIN